MTIEPAIDQRCFKADGPMDHIVRLRLFVRRLNWKPPARRQRPGFSNPQ
jgi:hypothetical protein